MLEAAQPMMWDQPKRQQPWYEKQPYSPANLMLDIANKAAGVISDPLFAIARGDLHRAAAGYVPGRQNDMDAGLARQSFDATGAVMAGSSFAQAPKGAFRSGAARMEQEPSINLYHGTTEEGAEGILNSKKIFGPAFFSDRRDMASDYSVGGHVIEAKVPISRLMIDADLPGQKLLSVDDANGYFDNPGWTINDYLSARRYSFGVKDDVNLGD